MHSKHPDAPVAASAPPLSVLRDQLCNGSRRILFSMEAVYRPIKRSLLKSANDILSPEYVFSGYHYHEGIEIFRVLEGTATAVVNNRTLTVRAGDLLIANAFEAHGTFLSDTKAAFSRICIMFHPWRIFPAESGVDRFFSDLKGLCFENLIPYEHPASAPLLSAVDGIARLCEERPRGWSVTAYAELIRFYATASAAGLCREMSSGTSYMLDFMTRVSAYIEDHLDEDISTTDIAAHCQYTTEHFCRLFKKCFDKTFKDYLNIYRIQKAKDFIDLGNFSTIAQISTKCGFNNQNHFSHIFKRYVGELPSEYINRRRESV